MPYPPVMPPERVTPMYPGSGGGGGTGGSGPVNTDALPEGSVHLYFTTARVLATALAGLSTAAGTVVTSAHTLLQAIGFLQKQVSDNLAAQMPLSYLDTDTALAANLDTKVASQKAVKAYINAQDAVTLASAQTYADSAVGGVISGAPLGLAYAISQKCFLP